MKTCLLFFFTCLLSAWGARAQSADDMPDYLAKNKLRSDTVESYDSVKRLDVFINYWTLFGEAGQEQRTMLKEQVNAWFEHYLRDLNPPDSSDALAAGQNVFEFRPETSQLDAAIHSTLYTLAINYTGSVHPNTFFYAQNYEYRKHKAISFGDYFLLKGAADTSALANLIDSRLSDPEEDRDSASAGSDNFLPLLVPAVFNLEGDSICFDYGDYALGQGPGVLSVCIERKALLRFINPEYRVSIAGAADSSKEENYFRQIATFDLSTLWCSDSIKLDDVVGAEPHKIKHPEPLGFMDTTFQRFYIHFNSSHRDKTNPYLYQVTGKTRVRNTICPFKGTLQVDTATLNQFSDFPGYKEGKVVCRMNLEEDPLYPSSGGISGIYTCNYLIDSLGKLRYNALALIADGYRNNQFEGIWTGHKTKMRKKCCWGDFRIPDCGNLDWGTGEFMINEKYQHRGWDDFYLLQISSLEDQSTENFKKAVQAEERIWWK
jgi:hypothetical protein